MTDAAKTPQPEKPKEPTRSEVKAELRKLTEKLQHMDAQKHSGAAHRSPKERMLDASAIEKSDPEHHYLYVNADDPGNLQTHLEDGYKAVSEEDCKKAGVRQRVGELVLTKVPREEYEERVERQKEVAKSRLDAHRAEFRQEVEGVVKDLRDRGYSQHEIDRILVDE